MNRKRTALSIGICFLCLVLLSLYHLPAASGSGSRKPQNFDRQAPSLEQQIAHEHVKNGSVLERVIKENQQFYMLDAEEFTDSLPYPLWLRVYWRKAHPEMRYQPTDTTGGYPRHMKRLYDWMVGNQNSVNLLSAQAMTNEKYPPWPTLEQQLAESEVKPGSKLEALIKANQDFSLLRPEEAGDTLRIPYWLRVIHRKAHPEVRHSVQDASGGYPFVLKEAHEWMMEHQDLQTGKPEPFVAPNKTVTPGLELRVSGTQTARRSESDIRINYWDTNKIISASNNIGGSGLQGQYFSTDNGVTWGQTNLPLGPSPDAFHSDPTVDWTSDGTAWSSTLGLNSGVTSLSLRNYRSSNNGATWTFEATASGSQTNVDKQMVWVDHSATSPFKDQMYAIWHNGDPVFMNRRTAGAGGTWGTPIQVSGAETTGTGIGSDVKSNSSGDVYGAWPDTGSKKIYVVKSTNGGTSWSSPVQIATTFGSFDIGVPSFNGRRALIYVTLGTYRTAVKNNVYATWTDLDAAGSEPGSNVSATRKTRIWFSRSTNGGTSWSTPVMINNQAGLNDQYNQWLAVDETTGSVSIIYYDTVADAGRKKVDIWYQSSFDDGVTFGAAVKITSAQTDETIAGADSGNQFGDYNGLTGHAGQFFPSWTDRRNNGNEEIWTRKITDTNVPTPSVVAAGSSITAGNCGTPATANIDPGETVTVSFGLQNLGTADTGTITATLRATGGVTAPSAAQSYGVLTQSGAAVNRSFTFTANGSCGSTLTATFDVTDGTYTTVVTYTYTLGTTAMIFSENFDGVTAPALPAGWTTAQTGTTPPPLFATTTTNPDTAPNTTFTNGVTTVASNSLISPTIALPAGGSGATVSFRHAWNFEGSSSFFDGGILELSTDGGTNFTNVVSAPINATFTAGGYTGTISTGFSNPIGGQMAWSLAQTSFTTSTLQLPVALNGQNIRLRWRAGWDSSNANANPNWRIDSISISAPSCPSCVACPTITLSPGTLPNVTQGTAYNQTITASGGTAPYTFAVTTGTLPAGLTLASGGALTGTPTGSGTSNFTVTATATGGCTGSQAYSITVNCPTITLSPGNLVNGTQGTAYSQTITASGGTGPYTYAVTTGTLPAGLSLSNGGALTGTPTGTGTANFTVTATGAGNCTGSQAYSVTISGPANHTVTQFYPVASTTGKTITITGTGFVNGSTQVFFGGANLVPATTVTFVNSTTLQVVVPASSTGAGNINGVITVRVNGADVNTSSLPQNAADPSNPAATFPEFVLWGDTTGDGLFATSDSALARAFILFQATPTARQLLAADVVPLNANGSRGNGGSLSSTDFSFLRAVLAGQATF